MTSLLKSLLKNLRDEYKALAFKRSLRRDNEKALILMYHRILPSKDPRAKLEEPGMMVTPESFEMQMKSLAQSDVDIVRLSDLYSSKDAEKFSKTRVVITFDDGWLDNLEFALPILEKYQVPATIFIVSDFLGQAKPFWPNRVIEILESIELETINNSERFVELLGQPLKTKPNNEEIAHTIKSLKRYKDSDIFTSIDSLWSLCHQGGAEIVNQDQLKELAEHPLIDIGCHTRTHVRLKENIESETLLDEIVESKRIIESMIEQPVPFFCFPNGDYGEEALQLVSEHFQGAVTTLTGVNSKTSIQIHPHELKRIGLHEHMSNSQSKFFARLLG